MDSVKTCLKTCLLRLGDICGQLSADLFRLDGAGSVEDESFPTFEAGISGLSLLEISEMATTEARAWTATSLGHVFGAPDAMALKNVPWIERRTTSRD